MKNEVVVYVNLFRPYFISQFICFELNSGVRIRGLRLEHLFCWRLHGKDFVSVSDHHVCSISDIPSFDLQMCIFFSFWFLNFFFYWFSFLVGTWSSPVPVQGSCRSFQGSLWWSKNHSLIRNLTQNQTCQKPCSSGIDSHAVKK